MDTLRVRIQNIVSIGFQGTMVGLHDVLIAVYKQLNVAKRKIAV